jgi:hypothetical protein
LTLDSRIAASNVTKGWFAVTESPACTSTVLTAPKVGKDNSTFFTGTTIAEADTLPEAEPEETAVGSAFESNDTVGIAVASFDVPQADRTKAVAMMLIRNILFIFSL